MATAAELSQSMATLDERLNSVRRDIETINGRIQKLEDALNEVKTKLAVMDERLGEMKKAVEESSRRRWAVVPVLVGVVIGGVIAFLGQVLIKKLFP